MNTVASSTYPCPQVHSHLETHIAEYDADQDENCLSKSPALLTFMLFAGVRFRHTVFLSFFSIILRCIIRLLLSISFAHVCSGSVSRFVAFMFLG